MTMIRPQQKEKTMNSVFISHSSKDALFQDRLVEILKNHGVKTWSSAHDLQGGDDYKEEINSELFKADTLIIIVSKNSKKSNWVSREITFFQVKKPESMVLPICLDETDANSIYDGLGNYHSVDFSLDHISGYKKLLTIFDKDFSYNEGPRVQRKDDRRSDERRKSNRRIRDRRENERRKKNDRRSLGKSQIARRLRVGFLNYYMRETRNSQFYEINLYEMGTEMHSFTKSLQNEANNFIFIDENQVEVNPIKVLDQATLKIWNEMLGFRDSIKVAYLIDAVVGELVDQYKIEIVDRRKEDQRKGERREKDRRNDERREKDRREP
jgi:hypothetical protein